ncbi:4-hydroxy-tetrahydrodipicolinate reductase [uncultured Eubacterium sp.]|uniref:4-hydroxy-tetrahydrodipicolinate reductase n=1 Tax=uncultured Eubacterium sp. TaxID=165185 RepID=UPI0025D89209|nr:4-hydroxy-tetrahydrodipicolinate reductase [uncultured Eubacterium sp.]
MTRIILSGCCGKMGGVIQNIVANRDDATIVAGVDKYNNNMTDFPVYENISDVKEEADVVIDFSNPSLLDSLLEYGKTTKTALVIATTGYDDCQKKKIADASKECPVFFTYNYSLGINLLATLAKKAAALLGDEFDIEIVEQHHNQKIDAPSGTALMLADAINEELDNRMKYEYDRHSKREKRKKNEIGMHSIRGGTIVGEHEIIFAGRDEIITLSHSARSKEVFAVGAVNAAVFMAGKEAGMYDMAELVK